MNAAANEDRWALAFYLAIAMGVPTEKISALYAKRQNKELGAVFETVAQIKAGECNELDWKERISSDIAFGRPVEQAVKTAVAQLENSHSEEDESDLMKLYIYSQEPLKALQLVQNRMGMSLGDKVALATHLAEKNLKPFSDEMKVVARIVDAQGCADMAKELLQKTGAQPEQTQQKREQRQPVNPVPEQPKPYEPLSAPYRHHAAQRFDQPQSSAKQVLQPMPPAGNSFFNISQPAPQP